MIEPVIGAASLRALLDSDRRAAGEGDLVVADVRWALGGPPGREAYAAGHLPGAVFVDLDVDLAAPATEVDGRHPLPTPADFAAAMTALGIGDRTVVVAYDAVQGSSAARLVWMLRTLGHEAALLDGGLAAWDGSLETGEVAPTPADPPFTAQEWPAERVVDGDTTAALAAEGVTVLDARVHGRFTGAEPAPADPRPGHVPGASSAPWQDNLDEHGRFRSAAELREKYATAADGEPPVVYCGSGVTACVDLLAMERAGIDGARLYPGSWSQWAADPSRPVATGD